MASHIHNITKAKATPLCGATTGVCVEAERAKCPACIELDAMSSIRVTPPAKTEAGESR